MTKVKNYACEDGIAWDVIIKHSTIVLRFLAVSRRRISSIQKYGDSK